MSLDGRIRLAVRREGAGGALRLIAGRAARLALCSEDHVWFVRDLLCSMLLLWLRRRSLERRGV